MWCIMRIQHNCNRQCVTKTPVEMEEPAALVGLERVNIIYTIFGKTDLEVKNKRTGSVNENR